MFDEVGIPYYSFVFFDGGRKLEHPVAKLKVVVEIVGFSDIGSAAEEKRTGDDKKVMETEESIPYILYWLRYPDVEIDHFSNSILHIVVYGQIDSHDEAWASRSFDERELRNVEEPHHAGISWSAPTTEDPVLRQEVRAGRFKIIRYVLPYKRLGRRCQSYQKTSGRNFEYLL
ncbi:hypothetical protein TNCV_1865951 [Trichonephila clavipes]|nr:hypothetical protein TNCV_1865951 [Trichonephila clavipes]